MAAMRPGLAWLSPLTFMLILPAGAVWLWLKGGHSLWDLGIRSSHGWKRRLIFGLGLGLLIPLLFQGIEWMAGWITVMPRTELVPGMLVSLPIVLVKMILIVAVEELVFRGFILQTLSPKTGFLAAAAASSLLWGLGHLTSMVQAGLATTEILIGMATFLFWGITLCLCTLPVAKSLWLPYGLHLGINLSFSLLGLPFIIQPQGFQKWIGNPAWSPESGWIGVVVWLALALITTGLTGVRRMKEFPPIVSE